MLRPAHLELVGKVDGKAFERGDPTGPVFFLGGGVIFRGGQRPTARLGMKCLVTNTQLVLLAGRPAHLGPPGKIVFSSLFCNPRHSLGRNGSTEG